MQTNEKALALKKAVRYGQLTSILQKLTCSQM